ncbi:YfhO family protein [Enterococcus larvae]|uniref:YfhO family protein n=1 Tax=Enterococcus larvae TaxID=2794352 RepID=UPI003F3F459A
MKNKIGSYIKNNYIALLASFILPITILVIVYAMNGIYFGSEQTLLASDSFSQYSNFHASFNNVLHGEQNIFYTWYGSLGLNYWSFSAYYLNSLFTPLVFFFDNSAMPDALYVITLVKFGAIGLSFCVFATQTFKKMSWWQYISFSVAYALMGYTVAYSPVIMWLDAFVYLPWIILGINRLLKGKSPQVLFWSYLLLFLSNFYMAFIVGLFSFLFYLVQLFIDWKQHKKSIRSYLIAALSAGGASMLTILPTIMDLKNNGESLETVMDFFTKDTGIWDFIVKNMVGTYDTSKYESAPFVYIGLIPLIFCCFYFVSKKFSLRSKIGYGFLLLLVVASVYIEPLNLLWHGLHAPNMFLFRFSFLASFIVILLGCYGFEAYETEDRNKLFNICLSLGGLFIAAILFSNPKRYNYITNETLYVTIGLLVTYLIFLSVYKTKGRLEKIAPILLLTLMLVEVFFNTKGMVAGIRSDWGYPKREYYTEPYSDIEQLVDGTKAENDSLYRLENLDEVSFNDSFNYGYSGVTMFSSIRNRHSSAYLNGLGYRSLGTNLNISYANNTLLMDALLGIKYNISKEEPMKFGFQKIGESGAYSLYENQYALPLGMLTDKEIFGTDAVKNQVDLFTHLSGVKDIGIKIIEPRQVALENTTVTSSGKEQVYTEISPTRPQTITWSVYVPAKQQAYISLYPTDMSYMFESSVETTVNGVTRESKISSTGQYYNLGYYEEGTTVQVTASFTGAGMVKIYKPDILLIDTVDFEKAVEAIQEKGVSFQTTGRTASATVDLEEDQVIFTTIPYDAGWSAYIDGKKVTMPTFKKAFLTLEVPAGKHEIQFVFLPQGFKIGAVLFASCLVVFQGFAWYERRKKKSEGLVNE